MMSGYAFCHESFHGDDINKSTFSGLARIKDATKKDTNASLLVVQFQLIFVLQL